MIKEDRKYWKLLVFFIPTLGIYNIVFWYKLTKDLNEMNPDKKKLPNYILVVFLTIITLGIYRLAWFYWVCDRIQTTGKSVKLSVRPASGLLLFLKTFGTFVVIGPFVATAVAVSNMNKVAAAYNKRLKSKMKVVEE